MFFVSFRKKYVNFNSVLYVLLVTFAFLFPHIFVYTFKILINKVSILYTSEQRRTIHFIEFYIVTLPVGAAKLSHLFNIYNLIRNIVSINIKIIQKNENVQLMISIKSEDDMEKIYLYNISGVSVNYFENFRLSCIYQNKS